MAKLKVILRILVVLLSLMVSCLLGFDTQTKEIMLIKKKATFRDLNSLHVAMYVFPIVAGYNLLRLLCSSISFFSTLFEANFKGHNVSVTWIGFLLDQLAAYIVFGSNCGAFQGSILAVTGQDDLQWMKLCDKYSKFCVVVGAALTCGYITCIALILLSSLSAFNLFRLYSSKTFLSLKST